MKATQLYHMVSFWNIFFIQTTPDFDFLLLKAQKWTQLDKPSLFCVFLSIDNHQIFVSAHFRLLSLLS